VFSKALATASTLWPRSRSAVRSCRIRPGVRPALTGRSSPARVVPWLTSRTESPRTRASATPRSLSAERGESLGTSRSKYLTTQNRTRGRSRSQGRVSTGGPAAGPVGTGGEYGSTIATGGQMASQAERSASHAVARGATGGCRGGEPRAGQPASTRPSSSTAHAAVL